MHIVDYISSGDSDFSYEEDINSTELPPIGSIISKDECEQYFWGLNEVETIEMMKTFCSHYYTHDNDPVYGFYGWECNKKILNDPSEEVIIPFIQKWNESVIEDELNVDHCMIIYHDLSKGWCGEFTDFEGVTEIKHLLEKEINELLSIVHNVGYTVAMTGME